MLVCYQLLVAAVLLLGPGVRGYCIDCNRIYKSYCRVNKTGYFCEPGATILSAGNVMYRPPSESVYTCTPPEYSAVFVNTFCCFYSPELGCALAINPTLLAYENRPVARCMDCSIHCDCVTDGGSTPFQSWAVFCILGSLALSLISG
ncbi:hypothetical protein KR032_012041 [Drosophila birchii]|nr:hypothetical protein KR032_012041 [Drosophila birchii]